MGKRDGSTHHQGGPHASSPVLLGCSFSLFTLILWRLSDTGKIQDIHLKCSLSFHIWYLLKTSLYYLPVYSKTIWLVCIWTRMRSTGKYGWSAVDQPLFQIPHCLTQQFFHWRTFWGWSGMNCLEKVRAQAWCFKKLLGNTIFLNYSNICD